jgi:hypothetical protein
VPLPLLRRCLCRHCASIVALVALESLLLFCWCCCHCYAGVITLLCWHCHPLCCAGIVAAIAMAPSLLRRFLLLCCTDVISLVALASLLSLRWCCGPQCAGIVAIIALALSPVPLAVMASLPCCAGIIVVVAMAPLPSLHWLLSFER